VLLPVLFVAVIALASIAVALMLSPTVVGANAAVERVGHLLQVEGSSFRRLPQPPTRSVIYANDGKTVLATVYLDENREIVRLGQVSKIARKAVLAIEDHGFYQHGPVNLSSVVRAMLANIGAGHIVQGGSTITQQLVKNTLIADPTETIARKVQEAALAVRVEQKYTKNQILEAYLNEIYMGNGVYGIGTAAEYYFGEPAAKLTLPQAAVLAGMIAGPEDFNPIDHPKRARRRRNQVLKAMDEYGWAKPNKARRIEHQPIALPPHVGHAKTEVLPPIVSYMTNQILTNADHEYDAFGKTEKQRLHTLYQGGLKIVSTLDPDWQEEAQKVAQAHLPSVPDTAIVSLDNATGAIRTMLSGKDYAHDQIKLATQPQQPGSSFKPFTLVTAFEQGISPNSTFSSKSPQDLPGWGGPVSNAEPFSNGGAINLWTATQDSVNVVFAQLALKVGPQNIVDTAHTMGITTPLLPVPSITLGADEVSPLEMASGYQTLANQGVHCTPYAVQSVRDSQGTVYKHKPECKRVISPEIANLVTAMLERVVTGGTGTAANIGRPVAGKTGTTQDATDVWFVGYTPQISTAVWVGLPGNNLPMYNYFGYNVFGGTIAAPIWHDYMMHVMSGMPVEGFPAAPSSFGTPVTPPKAAVPNVVGMDQATAESALGSAGFKASIRQVDSPKPQGTVVSQSPGGGTKAEVGSTVSLDVSSGAPATIGVPNVVGDTPEGARSALRSAGFNVAVSFQVVAQQDKIGVVIGQDPSGGSKIDPGSTVSISVGKSK
jgi:1A family penicillin-binding protein